MDARRFADVEALVVSHLAQSVEATVATATPPRLEDSLPFVRVIAGPGSDDEITENVLVDVEAFASTREAARDLAEECRAAMRGLTATAVAGDLVDRVSTAVRPQYVYFNNPKAWRFVASYRLWQRVR